MANQVGKLIGRTPGCAVQCSQAGRETCGLGFYHFGHISHITATLDLQTQRNYRILCAGAGGREGHFNIADGLI